MATNEEVENAKRLRQEFDDLVEAKKKGLEIDEERFTVLRKIFEEAEKTAKQAKATVESARNYLETLEVMKGTTEILNLRHEAALNLLQAQKSEIMALIREGKVLDADLESQLATIEDQLEATRQIGVARTKNQDLLNLEMSLTTKVRDMRLQMIEAKGTEKFSIALRQAAVAAENFANSGINAFMGRFTGALKDTFLSFDTLTKSFEKQFALGEDFKQQTKDIYTELDVLGVSMEDATKAAEALVVNFTDFTMLADSQQKSLRETANILEKSYGIAFEDFAGGLQVTTKAMGMSANQAKSFGGELAATAQALGLSIPGLVEKFNKMGPELAKFGETGVKHFKELARISKLTGIEMEKLLSITNQFDTFEGAAERAGMLNAALGGSFVNAMDLMMATDPAERFQMIRNAIDQTGLSFDEMGYYQRIFFAEAAGLDNVNDLALLMSGNMDMLSGATNQNSASIIEQKERAMELQDVMTKINSIFVDLANSTGILDMNANELIDTFKKYAVGIGVVIGLLKGLAVVRGLILASRLKSIATSVKQIATGGKEVLATQGQTNAIIAQNAALRSNLKLKANIHKQSMKYTKAGTMGFGGMSPLGIAAVGVALFGLGMGLKEAAKGMGTFVAAFKDMSVGEILAMTVPVVGLSLAFGKLAIGLVSVAPASKTAAVGLLAVGVGVLAIGAGVGLAATGMAELVKSFKGLSVGELTAAGLTVIAFSAAIGGLALALAGLANPLSVAGAGVLAAVAAVGAGAGFLFGKLFGGGNKEKENAAAMGSFFEGMSGVSELQYRAAQSAFENIRTAINDTSGSKLLGYTVLAKAGAIAPAPLPAVAGATAARPTVAAAGTTVGKTEITGEVEVKFNTPLFEDAVINIIQKRKTTVSKIIGN